MIIGKQLMFRVIMQSIVLCLGQWDQSPSPLTPPQMCLEVRILGILEKQYVIYYLTPPV